MASKKQYYKLDEVGFVGTQEEKIKADVKKDIEMTVEYIKAKKSGHIVPLPQKSANRLVKAK